MKVLLLLLLFSVVAMAETSDTFIVRIYSDRIKVLAPAVKKSKMSLIIENKTFVKIMGKVINESGEVLGHVNVRPDSYKVFDIKRVINQKYYFVPLSPAFQEAELKVGKKSYEIPSKG